MKEDSAIMFFAVVALLVSIVAAGVTYFTVSDLVYQITGLASTGQVNLTIDSSAVVNFSIETLNWGPGRVNTTAGCSNAFLDTQAGAVTCGNWSAVSKPLWLVNLGNVNVTLNLSVGKTAATFLGGAAGGGPAYKWNVSENETNSCFNATGGKTGLGTQLNVFSNPNTSTTLICNQFGFLDAADEMKMHFNLTVPSDSFTGVLSDTVTATVFSYKLGILAPENFRKNFFKTI